MPASKKPPTPAAAPRFAKKAAATDAGRPPSELIDERIAQLPRWRGATLAEQRAVIRGADPGIVERAKWNAPVWACDAAAAAADELFQQNRPVRSSERRQGSSGGRATSAVTPSAVS